MQCLEQLRSYVGSLGGNLSGEWKCRAQIRDYGSRVGSLDTWFTSPEGDVYRSKIAVARGIGLEPSSSKTPKERKPKAHKKPSGPSAAGGGGKAGTGGEGTAAINGDETVRLSGTGTASVELSMDELAELILSMPCATDQFDVYEGLLFYKDALFQFEQKKASLAKDAATKKEMEERAEAAARELEEAEAKAQAEAEAEAAAAAAAADIKIDGNPENDESGIGKRRREKKSYTEPPEPMEIEDPPVATAAIEPAAVGGSDDHHDEPQDKNAAAADNVGDSNKPTPLRSAAAEAAAQAAARKFHIETMAKLRGFDLDVEENDGENCDKDALEADPTLEEFMPKLDDWQIEMEIIRKCFVKVPIRLGRPSEDEPIPMSPSGRDAEVTDALLNLSDGDPVTATGPGRRGSARKGREEEVVDVAFGHWSTKRFPIDQLCANDGAPIALHPAALFFLRYQEEEEARQERAAAAAAAAAAARREAKRQERLAAGGGVDADGRPLLPLPKPANLSLRGKSIVEIEEALMERLAAYVSDLGGVLPPGWSVKASVRQNGANAGGVDAYYYDPYGRRHKSMIKVATELGLEGSAATKPRPLGSILGSRAKAEGDDAGGGAKREEIAGTGTVEDDGTKDSPAQDVLTPVSRKSLSGSDPEGSGRKTCGECRTCLNPQLKKGCLVNKAKVKKAHQSILSCACHTYTCHCVGKERQGIYLAACLKILRV